MGRSATAPTVVETDWLGRATAHRARVDAFIAAHRARGHDDDSHPVWDFLFTYYSLRPRQLRVWHPGYGTVLGGPGAEAYLDRVGYVSTPNGVTVSEHYLQSRLPTVRFIAGLLQATASRPARLNCFGMHEWAMVYRAGAVRHAAVPLRLGPAGTDAVVEATPLRCSHFDAFRFFTAPAARRNESQLTRSAQVDSEQPGCLHATMDLYKWCYKLGPLVDSELLMDCLELAAAARELDMRASPYDLVEYGFEPVPVEEPAGRADYVRHQALLFERAVPMRAALLTRCQRLLAAPDRRIGSNDFP